MCGPAALPALAIAASVVTAGGALYAGSAAAKQGKYEQQVAEENAKLERNKVADATTRGNIEQQRRYRELAQAQGRARAAMGAAGLDLGFGSALGVQLDQAQVAGKVASIPGRSSNLTQQVIPTSRGTLFGSEGGRKHTILRLKRADTVLRQ